MCFAGSVHCSATHPALHSPVHPTLPPAPALLQGDLVIEGDNSDLSVGGTATVAGATTLSSGATITAPVLGGSALTVSGLAAAGASHWLESVCRLAGVLP